MVRTVFGDLATAWKMELDGALRAAWDMYAAQVPKTDALGQTMFITGFNWYVACNTPRLQASKPRVDIAPVIFNQTMLSPVSFNAITPSDYVVTFNNTDEWAGAIGGFLFLFAGGPTNDTIQFYKGPFARLAPGFINGAVVPPASPNTQTKLPEFNVGQKLWLRVIASAADGRLSAPQILGAVCIV